MFRFRAERINVKRLDRATKRESVQRSGVYECKEKVKKY